MATFDELAQRLATGLTPKDRIGAAEALAELDDSRVAPALAKALADPSPEVRGRVEELLGQFCHRDKQGHLGVLLEEAQRVSSALAAEVSRLRDDAGLEAPSAAVEPIEPPHGYIGLCILVRLTADPMDVKRACQLVADAVGEPLFKVTRELHLTKGILARSVPSGVAGDLVRDLAEAGVRAAAAPVSWLPEMPELLRLRDPQFGPRTLRGTVTPGGEELEATWDTLEIVAAGRLEVELKRGQADEDWSLFTRPLEPMASGTRVHQASYEYIVDVYASQPLRRLRLLTHELDFDVMQRKPSEFGRVARLARELTRCTDHRRLTAGVRRLADLDSDSWDDLTFLSLTAFEHYTAWQRLLLALGVPLPR